MMRTGLWHTRRTRTSPTTMYTIWPNMISNTCSMRYPTFMITIWRPNSRFAFTASDGLDIEGYITFPVDSDGTNLPTVVLVHGGPWVRDTFEYDAEVQFLANRGYAVLQINYRGSAGYGKAFMHAGDMEWGR